MYFIDVHGGKITLKSLENKYFSWKSLENDTQFSYEPCFGHC